MNKPILLIRHRECMFSLIVAYPKDLIVDGNFRKENDAARLAILKDNSLGGEHLLYESLALYLCLN